MAMEMAGMWLNDVVSFDEQPMEDDPFAQLVRDLSAAIESERHKHLAAELAGPLVTPPTPPYLSDEEGEEGDPMVPRDGALPTAAPQSSPRASKRKHKARRRRSDNPSPDLLGCLPAPRRRGTTGDVRASLGSPTAESLGVPIMKSAQSPFLKPRRPELPLRLRRLMSTPDGAANGESSPPVATTESERLADITVEVSMADGHASPGGHTRSDPPDPAPFDPTRLCPPKPQPTPPPVRHLQPLQIPIRSPPEGGSPCLSPVAPDAGSSNPYHLSAKALSFLQGTPRRRRPSNFSFASASQSYGLSSESQSRETTFTLLGCGDRGDASFLLSRTPRSLLSLSQYRDDSAILSEDDTQEELDGGSSGHAAEPSSAPAPLPEILCPMLALPPGKVSPRISPLTFPPHGLRAPFEGPLLARRPSVFDPRTPLRPLDHTETSCALPLLPEPLKDTTTLTVPAKFCGSYSSPDLSTPHPLTGSPKPCPHQRAPLTPIRIRR